MSAPEDRTSHFARRALHAWMAYVQRHAARVAVAALLLSVGLGAFTATHLSVDTDTENMLSAQLPWRQAEHEMDRLFPTLDPGLVLVIDGATPELADDAQRRAVAALKARPELFKQVFAAETEPFFRRSGLLYLDTPQLQALADGLNQAQPFLGTLAQDPSLHGLFTLLNRAVTQPAAADFDLKPAFGGIAKGIEAATAGRFYQLSWQELMGAGTAGPDPRRRFVEITPAMDFNQLFPAEQPIAAIRAVERELQLDAAHGLNARLTGSVALEHEELHSAFSGGMVAFAAALAMVAVLLFMALRSLRLVVAAVLTLAFGLLVTAAFAAGAVGHLNLISIAFSVLYVGLGIDYALYLCMQYRELLGGGMPPRQALPQAAEDIGGYMAVCAATTSLGFFAFVPTPFTGIAELGLIAGVGMFVSLVSSLVVLPALITLWPPDPARVVLRPAGHGVVGRILDWPYTRARAIWCGAALLAAGALFAAPKARFDYDPLDLRDPHSESVATFRDLLKDPDVPTLTLAEIADSDAQAQQLAGKLGTLPLVSRAMSLHDFIPQEQDAKLAIVGDLNLSLGPALLSAPDPLVLASRTDDYAAIHEFAGALPAFVAAHPAAGAQPAADDATAALLKALQDLDAAWQQGDPAAHEQLLARLRSALLSAMPAQIDGLRTALQATAVTVDDLPPQIRERWQSADGHFRVEIWPKEVLDNPPAMERFVAQVRGAAPRAVGAPIGYIESGHSVVAAFQQAFAYSFIAITVLLLVLLRSVVDMLLVLIPLALAGLLTVAGSVLLNVPFNFANVIALPLILGVGVDYGVYLVQRGRAAAADAANLLHTGTARAVLFGALITTANFGNLMLAKHPGTVSMGVLLTLGLSMTLLCALVLLPSLLAWRYRSTHPGLPDA
ncbi:MAG: MMPL family transporter [Nevskia sp.]|nr:MMPL family transporter [Nevskia sp.]